MAYTPAKQILADHPANGRRFCRQCGNVKAWPADFIGLRGAAIATCSDCARSHGEYCRQWRRDRAHRFHQRRPSPAVGCVLPALGGPR